jgi:hypothetical protein
MTTPSRRPINPYQVTLGSLALAGVILGLAALLWKPGGEPVRRAPAAEHEAATLDR